MAAKPAAAMTIATACLVSDGPKEGLLSRATAAGRNIASSRTIPLHFHPRVGRGPEGLHLAWKSMPDLLGLPRIHVARQDREHGSGCRTGIHGPDLSQPFADGRQELVERAGLFVHAAGRVPLVVIGATHQQRQLRAKMHGQLQRDAVPHRA
jgi:hypothetical protein